jgi:hypothetical protein
MDAINLGSHHSQTESCHVKRVAAVMLFTASMIGVVALTHWLPTSPLSFVAGGGGPDRQGNGPNGQNRRRDHGGPRNQNSPDLSFGSAFETLGTIVPQVAIVGAFAYSVEKSRRKRSSDRRTALRIQPTE